MEPSPPEVPIIYHGQITTTEKILSLDPERLNSPEPTIRTALPRLRLMNIDTPELPPKPELPTIEGALLRDLTVEPRSSSKLIRNRVDIPPYSQKRMPSIPLVKVAPIGAIHPDSPVPEPPAPISGSDGVVSDKPTRPLYHLMTAAQQAEMRTHFRTKFSILRLSFREWTIVDPPETATLDQVHDIYEGYVKQIIIAMNCNQWKIYLVIMFLGIELFGVKVLRLDMRGYTKTQVAVMNRYDQVLIELGEKYYVQGTSNWPAEARIMMMAGFNALVFVIVKFLSKSLGGEDMASNIQGMIDQYMSAGLGSSRQQERDELGIPVPSGIAPAAPAAPAAAATPPAAEGGLAGLGQIFSGLMGGAGTGGTGRFDISSVIANIGSALTRNMGPNQTQKPARKTPQFTD